MGLEPAEEPAPTASTDKPAEPAGDATASPSEANLQNPGADIDHVDSSAWEQREFPVDDPACKNPVRIVVRQSVLNEIRQHGRSQTDVEICGVFAGNGYRDDNGPYVYIEAAIRGQHSDSQAAQVTFTGETWTHIQNQLDQEHPGLRIIGWYHTHPGFGVFLSGMDMFIQTSVFYAAEQMAFVYDPISGEEGLFVWRDGQCERTSYILDPDVPADPEPGAAPREEPTETQDGSSRGESAISDTEESHTAGAAPGDLEALHARIDKLERRQRQGVVALLLTAFIAVIAPLAVWLSTQPDLQRFFPAGGRSLFQNDAVENPDESP